jgi:hypothetical protein
MGRFGELYLTQPQKALELAEQCGLVNSNQNIWANLTHMVG